MSKHTEDNLQRLIEAVARRGQVPLLVTVGKVSNIDEDKRICDIAIDDDLTLNNCRLNAIIDSYNNRLLIVPKENSMVAFIAIGGKLTEPLVIAYSEIEKVLLTIGESDILIEDGKIEMNGGDLGGLIKIEELKRNLDQLKNYVEALNTAVSTGLSAVGESTLASGSAANTAYTTAMAGKSINFQDMEDDKITH